MSKVDEEIVREYFEGNGFLVRQLHKYPIHSRKKVSEEETDFLVFNPAFRPAGRKPAILLFSSELPSVERAIVTVREWGTRFTPGVHRSGAKLFRLLEQTVVGRSSRTLPDEEEAGTTAPCLQVLVLPEFPAVEPFKSQSVDLLHSRGFDGILSFRSMLLEVLGRVEGRRNYRGSDSLEMIRVLKNYDLIKDFQMELFSGMGR